jgi:hypothetical protein
MISTIVVLLGALLQWVASGFSHITGLGTPIEAQASIGQAISPEVPAGYAFSIWLLIFALSTAYGLFCCFQKTHPAHARLQALAAPLGQTFWLSSAWMILAQLWGDGWHLVGIIWLMAWTTRKALFQSLENTGETAAERWVLQPLVGLYAGWIAIAAWLNLSGVVKPAILASTGLSPIHYAAGVLVLALGYAFWLWHQAQYQPWFGYTLVWALIALVVANLAPGRFHPEIIVLCAVALAAYLGLPKRFPVVL